MCRFCDKTPGSGVPESTPGSSLAAAFRTWFLLLLLAVGSSRLGHAAPALQGKLERLREEYAALHAQFAADMRALAEFCTQQGFADDAQRIRGLAVPVDQQTADIDDLPEKLQPDLPQGLAPVENEWRIRLRALQTEYAKDLYILSRRAITEGQPSMAFHWIREVAFHDPDHHQARKALGFVRYEDGWATPFTAERLRSGFVWHDQFGWIQQPHVDDYERGRRYYKGKWMSATREASIRNDFRYGWEVLTEHFEIRTNHSLERGVELGKALEDFHQFFVREFAGFFNTKQQMQALFNSGSADIRGHGRRHTIYYYRTRGEYIAALKRKQSNIEITNGIYMPNDRIAYFYDDPENPSGLLGTMFHEVTHQLLGESARSIKDVGEHANFWLIEGIACYMESFTRQGGRLTVGDPLHSRIRWARIRLLEEEFFIPMARLTVLGRREFQFGSDSETLARVYSQVSGMVHFFLHAQDGVYREAFVEHLSQVYSPDSRVRKRTATLDQLTGVPFDELDGQYVEYIKDLPSAVDDTRAAAAPR